MHSAEVTASAGSEAPAGAPQAAVLVDFDNVFPGELSSSEYFAAAVDGMLRLALEDSPDTPRVDIRLYGGWLADGLLTKRASELQAALGSAIRFPIPHPTRPGLLRGDVQLATRMIAVPGVEWGHTLRYRTGLPRITLADQPYPAGCIDQSAGCPVRALQRFAKRPNRECHAVGCGVTNHAAFRVPEQKMVDALLCCDALELTARGWTVIVVSSDLDVVPAVAMAAARGSGRVSLVRSERIAARLYSEELALLGVAENSWEAP